MDVSSAADYFDACYRAVWAEYGSDSDDTRGVVIVVDNPTHWEVVGVGSCGRYSQRNFPSNNRLVAVNQDVFTDPTILAHEIGHSLCWPHSYSGETDATDGSVWEYDNITDVMSGSPSSEDDPVPLTVTHATNLYAAGWIPPGRVNVHDPETTATYTLVPPNADSGTQLLIIPIDEDSRLQYWAVGARIKGTGENWWVDYSLPRDGVEIYWIDQSTYACDLADREFCHGLDRLTRPIFSRTIGYYGGDADHLIDESSSGWILGSCDSPGESSRIDVISRSSYSFTVEVSPCEPADNLGLWREQQSVDEWTDEVDLYFTLSSEEAPIGGPEGTLYVYCYSGQPTIQIQTDTYVFGSVWDNTVSVRYRVASTNTHNSTWSENNNILFASSADSRWLIQAMIQNPGRLLFAWQNSSSTEWNTIRFPDTSHLQTAYNSLPCT